MMLKLILLFAYPFFVLCKSPDQCPMEGLVFPESFGKEILADSQPDSSYFPFVESGLQIFTHLKIPCFGRIKEFNFLSAKAAVTGLHIGVFRENSTDNSVQLVSDSYIESLDIELSGGMDEWRAWKPSWIVDVSPGDFLGIFYDHPITETSIRSLTIAQPKPDDPPVDTVVYLKSARDIGASGGKILLADGHVVQRIPAFYVVLEKYLGNIIKPHDKEELGDSERRHMKKAIGPPPNCSEVPESPRVHCEGEVTIRYFYRERSTYCREFVHCSTPLSSFTGFSSYEECMETCRKL